MMSIYLVSHFPFNRAMTCDKLQRQICDGNSIVGLFNIVHPSIAVNEQYQMKRR
jgi:hypothetical protein